MLKIENEVSLEDQEDIFQKKAQGFSDRQIAEDLSVTYPEITYQDVNAFLTKRKQNAVKVMRESGKLEQKFAEQYFDTINQLNELNQAILQEFYALKENPEYRQTEVACPECGKKIKVRYKSSQELIRAADHLLKQISHVDEILGRLKKNASTNVTYNIVDMTQKVVKIVPDIIAQYERRGYIKVLKKKKMISS
jgi:ssDNA-binding Zn-finger/Zn-ribbon topoisomerase 1